MISDVAGQSPQPKRYFSAKHEPGTYGSQAHSGNDKKFSQFTKRTHFKEIILR